MSKLKILNENQIEKDKENKSVISYSQFSMYSQCPYRWYKKYVEGVRIGDYSIHLLFGTATHETLQEYIRVLYTDGGKIADSINLHKLLLERMKAEFSKAVEQGHTDFTTPEEMSEFYQDGIAILDFIKKKRAEYFGIRGYELVGIEVPILTALFDENPNVLILGYLDLVIRDTILDRYYIKDIKTSTNGWNKWQKADETKTSQLLLYKEYFSKAYSIPKEKIDIEFFIVKRKLYENYDFPQKRVQSFKPAETKKVLQNLDDNLKEFVDNAFDNDGKQNKNAIYLKNPSDKTCKWCEYNTKDKQHCSRKNL